MCLGLLLPIFGLIHSLKFQGMMHYKYKSFKRAVGDGRSVVRPTNISHTCGLAQLVLDSTHADMNAPCTRHVMLLVD
jgi:hypothetical protein